MAGEDTILEHADLIDVDRARAVWRAALDAGPWPGPGVWIHGDLLGGNLLVRDRHLSAVIDSGPLKVADPAPDVAPAWTLFEGEARRTYRERLAVDDATWARARAWVMLPALAGIRYYEKSVPAFSQRSGGIWTRSWADVGVQTTRRLEAADHGHAHRPGNSQLHPCPVSTIGLRNIPFHGRMSARRGSDLRKRSKVTPSCAFPIRPTVLCRSGTRGGRETEGVVGAG